MDLALLEPCGGGAKNEIHMAADIAVLKILPPAIQKDGILPAEEAAVAEARAVAIHADGQRLADRPGGIFKRDVLRRKIIRIDRRGGCLEGADGFAFRIGDTGVK